MPKTSAEQRASPSIVYQLKALRELHHRGSHFVRCKPDKSPAERPGWQHRRPPLDSTLAHVQDGGLVGIIPASLNAAVLDVDTGDPERIANVWRPMVNLPTRRKQGAHLWYPSGSTYRNGPFRCFAGAGDIRSAGGYVVLWSNGADLADALERPEHRTTPFEEIAHLLGLWTPETLDLVAPVATPSPLDTAALRRHMARSLKLPKDAVLATEGSRNSRMFETLMYLVGRTADLRGSTPRLAALSARLNARCSPPLPADELAGLVRSVSAYSARWRPERHTQRFLAKQVARGRMSADKRRAANAGRNAAIVAARNAGQSSGAIAELHGISKSQVNRIIRG